MPDVWATFADLEAAVQDRLAGVLETRGADAQQQAMRRAFLGDVEFGADARVLEVGCGTKVLTRLLAGWPGVATVVGVDVAASLLEKARALASGLDNVTFEKADARSLAFDDESFDVVVYDSTLTTFRGPTRRLPRRSGCCARAGGSPPSTATTRQPASGSATTTRCRPASTR